MITKRRLSIGIIAFGLIAMGSMMNNASANSARLWKQVPVEPAGIAVKAQYSDLENVKLDVQEWFPNVCWRPGPITTNVDTEQRRVVIGDFAFYMEEGICPMVTHEATRSVDLGQLPPGEWELWILTENGRNEKAKEFVVQ